MKISPSILKIILFTGLLALLSCEKPDINDDPLFAGQLLTNSSDTILIDSHKYFLETELSRNLMPGGSLPTKRKLVAYISLVNTDSLPVSSNILFTKLYVIKDSSVWTSVPHEYTSLYLPAYKLTAVSTDGPEWATDIYVNVIAEVTDKLTGKKMLIKKLNQRIEALY